MSMLQQEQILLSRACAERATGIALPFDVQVLTSDSGTLTVALSAAGARIEADDINMLTRGFFMLSRAVT